MAVEISEEKLLMQKIAKVFNDALASRASHIRKLKDLSALRSSIPLAQFFNAFSKNLIPIFNTQRRIASVERMVQFVAIFACLRDPNNSEDYDAFFEQFLRFLIVGTTAAGRTARFRACQIISEIIMRLPDDAEVSSELWDEVIDCIKVRVGDKAPVIRTYSIRALSRFANDAENSDILELFLQTLSSEQNPDVRKTILLSLPPSNETSTAIINCTLDVNESVRKAAYCVLASKFPLQSLSIKQRTIILQRGLADRSSAVTKECLKLLKDEWLMKSCNGNPIELLKYLDVETYESIGVSVMEALLKSGLVKLHGGQSINQYLSSNSNTTEGHDVQQVDAEVALYLRTLCKHLQTEAQSKGSDAAMTSGTEAAVYASEASDSNDLLEKILPESVSDYIDLIKTHIVAGQSNRFIARQLLILASMLDFSDSTNRKVAAVFVLELLKSPLDHEVDDDGNKVVIGDGISLGGERDWADAVSVLAKKVHASQGEFEEIILGVIADLAIPCRERTADFLEWMHCLSVVGLLLEHTKSLRGMFGKPIEPAELLHSLLLPGAKHIHFDVQRAAIRCLGLFGILERNLTEELVKQLRVSFIKGPSPVSTMASKSLMDLATWHGPNEVDKSMNTNLESQFQDNAKTIHPVDWNNDDDLEISLIDLLYAGFEKPDFSKQEPDENESVQPVLAEGFAKILLLSSNYSTIPVSSHPILLSKLINLYFSTTTVDFQRLKQCLSVFFEHYPSVSINHKECICKAFIPVMKSMWPGINGVPGGASVVVSRMRKRAIQASRFMLQMLQSPLYPNEIDKNKNVSESTDCSDEFDFGEGLAICIAAEVLSFEKKKSAAEKAYVLAICKVLVVLRFRESEQVGVKLMRKLLNRMMELVSSDKETVKEVKQMVDHLKSLDKTPDESLPVDQANILLEKLGVEVNIDGEEPLNDVEPTPVPKSTKPVRARRRAREKESSSSSEEEESVAETVVAPVVMSVRSQRASKSAALSKLVSSNKPVKIDDDDDEDDDDDDGDEEVESEVTSEDESD